MDMLMNESD